MNILEKLMNVFRKRDRVEPRWKEGTEPSHGFGVGEIIPVSKPLLELARKQVNMASENYQLKTVLSDIVRTKQAIETAKKKKKRVSHLYDRLIDLKVQQLKLEGKK